MYLNTILQIENSGICWKLSADLCFEAASVSRGLLLITSQI